MVGTVIGREWSCRTGVTAVTLLVLVVGAVRAEQNPSPTIDEIQKAWQARQDRVRTARFTWKEQRTWPKGSISSTFGSELEKRMPEVKSKIMPPTDKTVDFSYVLSMDNDKIRFEYEGEEWANKKQAFRHVKYLSVFNGKTAKDLYPDGVGSGDWPQGVIRKGEKYRDAGLTALSPSLLVYRPFVPTLQPTDIRAMTLESQKTMIDGQPCVELVQRLPRNSSVHLWADTTRDFVLVRRLVIEQGKPFEQIDIRYRPDANPGWASMGWKVVSYNFKGNLLCSINADIISSEFNIGVQPSSFDLEFPPGARVQDERTQENYILWHDGTKRPILDTDIGATYEQMLKSRPGEALRPQHLRSRVGRSRWELMLAAVLGLSALGLFIWRRLRLRKSPEEGRG